MELAELLPISERMTNLEKRVAALEKKNKKLTRSVCGSHVYTLMDKKDQDKGIAKWQCECGKIVRST